MKKICCLLVVFVLAFPFFGLDNTITFSSGYAFRIQKQKDLSDGSYDFGALTFGADYNGFFTKSVGVSAKGFLFFPLTGEAFKSKQISSPLVLSLENDWSTGLLFALGPVFRTPISDEFEFLSSVSVSYEATWLKYKAEYDSGGKYTYKGSNFYQSFGATMGFSGVYNFSPNVYVRGGFDASFGLLPLKQLFEGITYDKDNKKIDTYSVQQTLEGKDVKEFLSASFIPTIGVGFRF